MAKEDLRDLTKFLKPFPAEIRETALWLREFVWDLYPKANELIYDNYNALAFGWSPTDRQDGNQYRYLLVTSKKDFPGTYIKKLLKEAYANSLAKVKDTKQLKNGITVTKSVSAAKRK